MKKKNDIPELLTLQEACKLLKKHPNTLRKWDEQSVLKAIRIGPRGDRMYKKEDILKLINKSSKRSKK